MAGQKSYSPKALGSLPRAAMICLGVYMASQLLEFAAVWLHSTSVTAGPDGAAQASRGAALFLGLTALFVLLMLVVTGFVTLNWTYRVSRNAHSLARGLDVPPQWAVGWYFVPVASVWKPFQALREVWQVGVDPARWRTRKTPAIMRWWWGFWLAGNLAGTWSNLAAKFDRSPAGAVGSDYLNLIHVAGMFAAAGLLFVIVDRISRMQATALAAEVFAPARQEPGPFQFEAAEAGG